MTREEAIEVLEKMKYPQKVNKNGFIISNVNIENEALDMAIQALSQEQDMTIAYLMGKYEDKEPCNDAISREAVKELIKCGVSTDTYDDVEQVCKWIDALPSVTQKSGHWIAHSDGGIWIKYYECSECGKVHDARSDFCPNCGAKMESEDKYGNI